MDYYDDFGGAPVATDWTSGSDLPGGGDTGNPVGPGSNFDVGPGQIPSEVYDYLRSIGGLAPGMSTSMPQGPGIGKTLSDMARGIGLTNKDGSPNWMSILSLLAGAGGAAYGINRTNKANDQMQQAVKDANAQITNTLGGSGALYDPYRQAGLQGLQRLQNAPDSHLAAGFAPLADRYKPLGTGAAMRGGLSLGNIAKGQ